MSEEVKMYIGLDLAVDGQSIGVVTQWSGRAAGKGTQVTPLSSTPLVMSGRSTFSMKIKNMWVDQEALRQFIADAEFDEAPEREYSPSGAV